MLTFGRNAPGQHLCAPPQPDNLPLASTPFHILMLHHRPLVAVLALFLATTQATAQKQEPSRDPVALIRQQLVGHGYAADDLADLVLKDQYQDAHNGVRHTYLRQRWQGIEVFNGDIAVHQGADGKLLKMNNGAWAYAAKRAERPRPAVTPEQALSMVLAKDGVRAPMPALQTVEEGGSRMVYDGTAFNEQPVTVQLMYLPDADTLRLVWNVNYYEPGGAHWWNVQVSAMDGRELRRNDWVSNCRFDHPHAGEHDGMVEAAHPEEAPTAPMAPAGTMEYRVYPMPVESPSHGSRTLVNAPWTAAGAASPYGWHDANGSPGAEYTITRGNNVHAQEDANGNNGTGYAPDGGASLSFDFPINLTQAPSTYQDAAITNLFYWNNLMHDVWYQYGFNEVSGNFQQNNYGRGGQGNDYVYADAQDGSGTNNANFATPPDGSNPRMQMFLWTQTNPRRDGDLDAGIIAHEYGHGISIRLAGGPSNSNCLNNAEQMGEGWSDFFGLMMTMKASDTRTTSRGVGTYVLGEPVTGTGIRPAPYNTSFGVNGFTYAATTNPNYQYVHDIGFIWCTILWEMTWDLIDQYGFDPDLYNGTGGNNIAMQLVIDGLKLMPCSPGFVDGRNAILLADQLNNGGANQNLLWAAFARRGLGYSASQGSSNSLNDQVEAFNMPLAKNLGVVSATPAGDMFACEGTPIPVVAMVSNNGLEAQSGFSVRYSFDGGAYVTEAFSGTLAAGATQQFTFTQPITMGPGNHTLVVGTVLAGDQYPGDDAVTNQIGATSMVPTVPPVENGAEGGAVPAGWTLQNPDNSTTWTTTTVSNGPGCTATTAWMINYNTYSATGQEDRLLTPPINLAGVAGTRLTFNHAYARYSSYYYDAFRVDVSPDCGATWNTVYQAAGSDLATAPDNTGGSWAPANCSQWATHDLDLGAYDGQVIVVRFVGICGYGQRLYMDNIRIYAPTHSDIGVDAAVPNAGTAICIGVPMEVKATLRNYGSEPKSGFSVRYSLDGGPDVTQAYSGTLAAGATEEFTFAQPLTIASAGGHTLEVGTVLTGDQNPGNDAFVTSISGGLVELPVEEGAESGTVPQGWTLENPDEALTWTTVTVNNGPLCASTKAWMIDYYSYANAGGQEDRLVTPSIDLEGMANVRLAFQHAYARYSNSYSDGLRVDISNDCGTTWYTVFNASGSALATASNSSSNNWAPSNCSQWAAHDIDLSAYDGQTVRLRFVGICGYGQKLYMDNIKVTGEEAGVPVAVRVLLGGPYNSTQHRMDDQLRANGLLPSEEPYTALGFNLPGGGGETATTGLLGVTGDDAAVDWVVVELRQASNPAVVVAAKSALVQRDGDVMAVDGAGNLRFNVPAGNYHVAVRHRNHLGCMTANAVALGGSITTVDLTSGSTATYGTDARRPTDGKWMLWPGDVVRDGKLQYTGLGNDREPMLIIVGGASPTATANGYLPEDVNLDGVVKYAGSANDRDMILIGINSNSPTSVRTEQLP